MKFLDKLFNPMSIAVIGASADTKKIGHQILKNIISGGFSGKIIPINLKENRILGLKTHPSVLKYPRKIDVAIIAIPAAIVPQVLEECGQKNIQDVVIISAGFSEAGEQGKKLNEKLISISKKYEINILGPNCLGFISSYKNLNASFAEYKMQKGNLSIISQSGALGAAILDFISEKNSGLAYFISLGNKTDLSEIDTLEYLKNDPKTKLILMYIEDTINGQNLIKAIGSSIKPIIILKGGRTEIGQKAAVSHTGALASSSTVFDAALKQAGAIVTKNLRDTFAITNTLINKTDENVKSVAIITNAGGPGIVATDILAHTNLNLAKISQETENKIKKILPQAASIKNPIDILGDADAKRYRDVLKTVVADKSVQSIIVILTPQTATQTLKTAKYITEISHKTHKQILPCFIGGEQLKKARYFFSKNQIAHFDYPKDAIMVLDLIARKERQKVIRLRKLDPGKEKLINNIISKHPINFAYQIAKAYGFPIIDTQVVRSKEELNYVAKSIGFPLVMKTLSAKVIHKSLAGGVKLDIRSQEELQEAYKNISGKFGPMISLSSFISQGVELYIGAKKDPQFGTVILFGLGGIYVESLKDITRKIFPIDKDEALKMINEIKAQKILKDLDKQKIAETILACGDLCNNFDEILEIDFNPIKVAKNDLKILDSRIVLKN